MIFFFFPVEKNKQTKNNVWQDFLDAFSQQQKKEITTVVYTTWTVFASHVLVYIVSNVLLIKYAQKLFLTNNNQKCFLSSKSAY